MSEERPTKRYLERVEPRLEEVKAWARDEKTTSNLLLTGKGLLW